MHSYESLNRRGVESSSELCGPTVLSNETGKTRSVPERMRTSDLRLLRSLIASRMPDDAVSIRIRDALSALFL